MMVQILRKVLSIETDWVGGAINSQPWGCNVAGTKMETFFILHAQGVARGTYSSRIHKRS
jgi:hypothetical protein